MDAEETCQIAGRLGVRAGHAVLHFTPGTQDIPRHSTFVCIGRAGVVPQVCSRSLCEPREDSITQCEEGIGAPRPAPQNSKL